MRPLSFGVVVTAFAFMVGPAHQAAGRATPQSQRAASPAADSRAQQPPAAVFRAGTNVVEVDAIVTDAQGRVVHGLTQSDFQIMEDGRPQPISVFAPVDIPIEPGSARALAAAAHDPEPDVQTNARPFEGRLYLIVLDDLHTHPLRSSRVKEAARHFVERHLGDGDMAAVVHTSGRADATQDFTSNRRLLLDAIATFVGRKLRSSALERMEEYNRIRESGKLNEDPRLQSVRDPLDAHRAYQARGALRTIKNLAELLGDVQGRRKALVFVGEGIDYDINDAIGQTDTGLSTFMHGSAAVVRDAVRDAIAAATQHNVSIYGVDPRGLAAGDDIEIGSLADNPNLGLGPADVQEEIRRGQDSLRVLSEATGGVAAVGSNDLDDAFARIVRDSSTYYMLGYEPPAPKRDGRFHRIEVRVNRPGLHVRARKGYTAARGNERTPPDMAPAGTSPEVTALLNSTLPEHGLKLAVTAVPLKAAALDGQDRKTSLAVTIEVRGQGLPFTMKDGFAVNRIELALVAVDEEGRVRDGDRVIIEPRMSPETRDVVSVAGFRLVRHLRLAPGRYRLRVGAREAETGLRGSVFSDVPVPDYAGRTLAMSGALLHSRASAHTITLAFDDALKPRIATPPTTFREFVPEDTLTAAVEVYDAVLPPHTIAMTTVVTAADGSDVFRVVDTRSSAAAIGGTTTSFTHVVEIPLADMKPGRYVLRIEAKPSVGAGPVSRAIPFGVVGSSRPTAAPESSSLRAPADTDERQASAAAFVNFAYGSKSNLTAPQQIVIRSQADFEKIWQELPTQKAAPAIDFDREMLVGVFLGTRPSGDAVRIVAVRRDGDGLVVRYRALSVGAGVGNTSEATSPFVIARVTRVDGPVRFGPM